MILLDTEQEKIQLKAIEIFEAGKTAAQNYAANFFVLGESIVKLRTPITVLANAGSETAEFWTVLAPAGQTSLFTWLEDEWDIPKSSLSSAYSIVSFYHTILGMPMETIQEIGRARLSAAQSWLNLTFHHDKLDDTLIGLLKEKTPVNEIVRYCAEGKRSVDEIQNGVKAVGVSRYTDTTNLPSTPQIQQAEYSPSDGLEQPETDIEVPDTERSTATLPRPSKAFVDSIKKSEPLIVKALRAESLAEAIWRSVYPTFFTQLEDLLEQTELHSILEDLRESIETVFGSERLVPLTTYIDDVPHTAGMIVVADMDEDVQERILKYVNRQLKG